MNHKNGFTLLEILIATAISVGVAALVTVFIGSLARQGESFNRRILGQSQASQSLQVMIPEIRSAGQSNVGGYAIEQASSTSVTFYSDIDSDGVFERIRYFLDTDNAFKKGIIEPTGQPLVYATSSEVVRTVIDELSMGSEPVFRYYDITATSTNSTELPSPIDVLEIKTIRIQLLFDEGDEFNPVIKGVENQATVRNLRFKESNEQY
ncbi:MAG: prepilin-type N-terminal cleavage/methylation domain-containing protein [Candidatus Paceibacterota bacterium]